MEKFVSLCKKPFLIFSILMFVVGFVLVGVVCLIPHGHKYVYKIETGEKIGSEMEITFDTNMYLSISTRVPFQPIERIQVQYKMNDGELLILNKDTGEYDRYPINAFKIDMNDYMYGVVLKCNENITFRTIGIVIMSVFGIIAVLCIVVRELDKRGKIKYAKALGKTNMKHNDSILADETIKYNANEETQTIQQKNSQSTSKEDALMQRLEKLKIMKESGTITEEKYNSLKSKVLSEF